MKNTSIILAVIVLTLVTLTSCSNAPQTTTNVSTSDSTIVSADSVTEELNLVETDSL
jgi:hypothetical protein